MDDGLRPVRYDVALALQQLAGVDAKLGALIARVGPFKLQIKSTHSPFEALLEAILYQQLHANAAKAILGRLLAIFGDIHPQPEQLLAVPEERLRAAGLSRNKLLSLRDLAAKTVDGTVPSLAVIRRMSDQEIVERLSDVRGIGTWTAEMLLIFRLGRPDVFPGTDYGIRKGYLLTFGKVKAGQAHHGRYATETGTDGAARGTLEALALGGQLVSVACLRPSADRERITDGSMTSRYPARGSGGGHQLS